MPSPALHPTELTYRAADLDREAARGIRNRAVRDALAEGKSIRKVAAEFGLSATRVAQIKRGKP